jgi:hypothetical protein
MLTQQEHEGAKDAPDMGCENLCSSCFRSIATLLYYVSIYMGGGEEIRQLEKG